jgi:hypothetical protein
VSGEKKLVGDMSFELAGANAPDDLPCRYGASKLMCRGPRRALEQPYVAFLGGSETYGKFVSQPFVALAEHDLGINCVNLGSANAGLDTFVQDLDILRITQAARLTVIQVLGAQNLSNRYYRVHPRRNDRFLAASPMLSTIYPQVDFTEFHFNKHLLGTLKMASPERFSIVRYELQQAWLSRMRLLISALNGQAILLWLRYDEEDISGTGLGPEPLLVDRQMLDSLRPDVIGITEIRVAPAGKTGELADMQFGPMQAPAAEHLIGPAMHRDIAVQVQAAIRPEIQKKARQ